MLAAQVGILLRGSDLRQRQALRGAVADGHGAQRSPDAVGDKLLVGQVGDVLLHIHQQAKVQARVAVLLVGPQWRGVDACHDGVVGGLAHVDAASGFDIERIGARGALDVGAEGSGVVAPGIVHHEDGVVGIAAVDDEFAGVGGGVHHHVVHIERGLDAALVEEQLAHGDVGLVGGLQAGDVLRGARVEVDEAEVVELHHAGKRAEGLRHGCEVVDGRCGDGGTIGRQAAVGAFKHHVAVASHQYLTAGKGTASHSIVDQRIHCGTEVYIHIFGHGRGVA